MDVRKELSMKCTGGKVGILSATPLCLPSQELNINHMKRRKVVLITPALLQCQDFCLRGLPAQEEITIKEAGQNSIISRIEVCFHL